MVNVKRYGSFNDALKAFKKQSKSIREEYKQHTAFVPENEQRRQKRNANAGDPGADSLMVLKSKAKYHFIISSLL